MRPIPIAVVVLLSIASPAVVPVHAQASSATLMGIVYDPLGAPVEGMVVYVESGAFGSGVSEETRTNKAGEYRFEKLAPGVYTISIPVEFAQPIEVALDEGKLVRQDIRMHIEEVAARFSVCIDCSPAVPRYVPPDSLVKEFATDRDTAAKQSVRGAEPAVGWEFYQPDVRVTDVIRARGLTGTVVLEMRIDTDDAIKDLTVVSSPHAELSAAAVAAVQSDRWNAATVRGVPLAVPLRLTIDFVRATSK